MRIVIAAAVTALFCTTAVRAQGPYAGMLKLTLAGRKIEGAPLAFKGGEVYLLARDGRLWEFAPDEATNFKKTSNRFRSYPVSELRAGLLRELGKDFEVSGTTHYLVAHRRGQRGKWARRFENLYRSFVHYFSVRGFKIQKPPLSLLGVVCKNERDFQRYAAGQGAPAAAGIQGYYSWISNRILLYDMGAKDDSAHWQQNASVVIHEATHQTAFNTGVHSRWTPPPLWVAEGLATMFEAPGVHDSRHYTQQSDRINRGRLGDFRRLVLPRHRPELIAQLVASDRLFRTKPAAAYAEAWALTFYLVETQPRKYMRYLALTADRPPFTKYTPAQRTADFTAVFGDDWRMLQARLLRFMAGLE